MGNRKKLISMFMLVITAFIWGTAFVAQVTGMESIGPLSFCAFRNLIAAVIMIPYTMLLNKRRCEFLEEDGTETTWKGCMIGGIVCGTVLLGGTTLQQVGLQYTTAGKAAFITSIYIVLVTIFGILRSGRISKATLFAVAMSMTGLYLISVKGGLSFERGDLIVFAGAFFWAGHILVCDKFSKCCDPLKISCIQYMVVFLLSGVLMMMYEEPTLSGVVASWPSLFYAGFFSSCIAYTFQMLSQRYVPPTTASIIMSMESIFAAFSGMIFLGETLTAREFIGCVLVFAATVTAQLNEIKRG
ncbi:MAG: DMT family transporter [Synergistes sp.]|nr:DMT family transporter [Synergistes sp.]